MILGQRLTKFQNIIGNKMANTTHAVGHKFVDHQIDKMADLLKPKPKQNFSRLEHYNHRKKMLSQ